MNLSHRSNNILWIIASQVSWETQLYHLIYRFVYRYNMTYGQVLFCARGAFMKNVVQFEIKLLKKKVPI